MKHPSRSEAILTGDFENVCIVDFYFDILTIFNIIDNILQPL